MNSSSLTIGAVLSPRSDVVPVDPEVVPIFVHQITVYQYCTIAVASILIYDALITLDMEAKYFWKVPQKPVDFVYFVNRYGGLFGAAVSPIVNTFRATLPLCNFAQWTVTISNWATIILIDYILTIRVLALYSRARRISFFLYTLVALEACFKLGLVIYLEIETHIAVGGMAEGVTFCGSNNYVTWHWRLVNWLIPLICGIVLMVLAFYKAAEYWRASAGFKGFTLVKVLIQDQVLYFMLVALCCTINIIVIWISQANVSDISLGILTSLGSPFLLSVLGSRILFNLKEAGERGQNIGTSIKVPSMTVSDMEFAEPGNRDEFRLVDRKSSGEAAGV